MNEQQLQAFQSGQYDWIIYLILVLFVLAAVFAWRFRVANKRAIQHANEAAEFIISQRWEVVEGAEFHDRRGVESFVLHIRSLNRQREERIPFRPGHPDIRRLRLLRVGDRIRFDRLVGEGEFALEHEVCLYLTLAVEFA